MVRVSTRGPFNPTHYVESNGQFNLVSLCYQATLWGWRVLFTGQWDGSLCHGCAMGVLAAPPPPQNIPREPPSWESKQFQAKLMGGHIGVYADFYEHARDVRCQQLLSERLRRLAQQSTVDDELPVQEMQPHVNINAAIMWMFATAIGTTGS